MANEKHWVVSWTIDVFEGETPREAAQAAWAKLQQPIDLTDPLAPSVFHVWPADDYPARGLSTAVAVDLSDPEE